MSSNVCVHPLIRVWDLQGACLEGKYLCCCCGVGLWCTLEESPPHSLQLALYPVCLWWPSPVWDEKGSHHQSAHLVNWATIYAQSQTANVQKNSKFPMCKYMETRWYNHYTTLSRGGLRRRVGWRCSSLNLSKIFFCYEYSDLIAFNGVSLVEECFLDLLCTAHPHPAIATMQPSLLVLGPSDTSTDLTHTHIIPLLPSPYHITLNQQGSAIIINETFRYSPFSILAPPLDQCKRRTLLGSFMEFFFHIWLKW